MKPRSYFALLFTCCLYVSSGNCATLHESAQLGEIGQNSGTAVSPWQYLGARFHIDVTSIVSRVGAHFSATLTSDSFFAAIVQLAGPTSLPLGSPFTDNDIVAFAAFSTEERPWPPSYDIRIPLRAVLPPGWYGLVFGGGKYLQPLFGAYGNGMMPANNLQNTNASYFIWSGPYPQQASTWINGSVSGLRFVVEGYSYDNPLSISSIHLDDDTLSIASTNLIWGYNTTIEARSSDEHSPWCVVSNSLFIATNELDLIVLQRAHTTGSQFRVVQDRNE